MIIFNKINHLNRGGSKMFDQKAYKKIIVPSLIIMLALITTGIKFSFVWGTQTSSFSIASMLLPLAGAFGGLIQLGGFFFAKSLLGLNAVTFGIPTFFSALNWSVATSEKRNATNMLLGGTLQVLIPLACMMLFLTHSIGGQAGLYSAYWLIPMVIFKLQLFGIRSMFLTALSSTFIAHALGSVMWLYYAPMAPAQWLALIPVVALERLAFALGGYLTYLALSAAVKLAASTYSKKLKNHA